jgi:hypothetical protein
MDFALLYILSTVISGYYISLNYDILEFRFSIKRYVTHGKKPGPMLTFVSLYLVAFLPILNVLMAFLVIAQFIVNLSYRKK